MATREFSAAVTVKCPPERAFDYFADHRHVAAVLDGVTKWEPIGGRSEGVGARYGVEMVALGFPLKSVLRLNRWRRPHEIGLRIAYTPPGAILGSAIAGRLDGVVRDRLQEALERIREELEG